MSVHFCSSSGRMLVWVGSRCTTTRKAMPASAGMAWKNVSRASRPPAEAPIPTTGKPGMAGGGGVVGEAVVLMGGFFAVAGFAVRLRGFFALIVYPRCQVRYGPRVDDAHR